MVMMYLQLHRFVVSTLRAGAVTCIWMILDVHARQKIVQIASKLFFKEQFEHDQEKTVFSPNKNEKQTIHMSQPVRLKTQLFLMGLVVFDVCSCCTRRIET